MKCDSDRTFSGEVGNPFEFSRNTQSWQCWHFCIAWFWINMTDRQIHHINYNSKHHGKCKFGFKCIRSLTVSNLFTFKVVQKCQCYQLCVLQENSIGNVVKTQTVVFLKYLGKLRNCTDCKCHLIRWKFHVPIEEPQGPIEFSLNGRLGRLTNLLN